MEGGRLVRYEHIQPPSIIRVGDWSRSGGYVEHRRAKPWPPQFGPDDSLDPCPGVAYTAHVMHPQEWAKSVWYDTETPGSDQETHELVRTGYMVSFRVLFFTESSDVPADAPDNVMALLKQAAATYEP